MIATHKNAKIGRTSSHETLKWHSVPLRTQLIQSERLPSQTCFRGPARKGPSLIGERKSDGGEKHMICEREVELINRPAGGES